MSQGASSSVAAGAPTLPAQRVDPRLADVVVIGALLALTAAFGKGFSTLGFPDASIYVTEVALAAAGGLALLRLGPAELVTAIRTRVPLIPLGVFWIAAAVAVAEGIRGPGLTATVEDIGLGEYSLVVPLLAAVACTMTRARLVTQALVVGLVAGTTVYAISDLSVRLFGAEGGFFDVQEITFGLYMAMLVAYVAAQIAAERRPPRVLVGFGALALVLIFLTNARGVWLGVLVALGVVTILARPGRRLRFGARAAAATLCALGLAIGIQAIGGASGITSEVGGAVRGVEDPDGTALPPAGASTEASDNARWRIAFWGEMIDRSVDDPVFGVGYGEPIAFTWEGNKYDFRDGDPAAVIDVDGPHNEYLHILYRMGYVGLGGLIALIVVALLRTWRTLRAEDLEPAGRALIVGLTGMWFASATVAFFADALKAPFLGLFFWATLGLLLAAVAVARPSGDGGRAPASA